MVTDGSAEIIRAFPHPNRQAGNFRPRENKLARFTHSSQSGGRGGRGPETEVQTDGGQNSERDEKGEEGGDREMSVSRRKSDLSGRLYIN